MLAAIHDASVQRRHGMSSSKYKNTPRLELKQNALSRLHPAPQSLALHLVLPPIISSLI